MVSHINLQLPNTPAVRELLGQLAGHLHDDVVGHFDVDGGEPNVAKYNAARVIADEIDETLFLTTDQRLLSDDKLAQVVADMDAFNARRLAEKGL